jgi:uncharacterized protein YodC (DUF2158 family)
MDTQLKVGDVVRLKSGGPDMTISRFESDGSTRTAYCGWFVGKKLEGRTFPVHMLELVSSK